jgi:hypothetical protein
MWGRSRPTGNAASSASAPFSSASPPTTASRPVVAITPVSDAVLANPLAVPAGVAGWLRGWERRIRDTMHSVVVDRATDEPSVPALDDALAELRQLHPDTEAGVFRLLIHRPLWQLAEGSAARETFDRYATTVIERVDAALVLMRELGPLRRQRDALVAEFGALFPNRLVEQLTRARARNVDIERLRRAVDVERMQARLARARIALERMATAAYGAGFEPTAGRVIAGEPESLAEMVVALTAERRTRRQLEQHTGGLRRHRERLAAELRGLALSAPPKTKATPGRGSQTPFVLEQLIATSGDEHRTTLDGRDAPLWAGAIAGAMTAHHPLPDRFAWTPSLLIGRPPEDEPPRDETTDEVRLLHAVAVDRGLLFLSPRAESAVRVRTRTVHLGDTVECQVAPEMATRQTHAIVARDVATMFDGFDAEHSRWYETTSRMTARLVASYGDGWFARLETRGVVAALDQPAWHAEGPGSAFRVLRSATAASADISGRDHPHPVALAADTPRAAFLGFTLHDVRTGLLGDERAWMRGVTSTWRGAAESIRREHALFTALHRGSGDPTGKPTSAPGGLQPIGWGVTEDGQHPLPLYRIPLATVEAPGHLRTWISERDEHLLAVLTGVARIIDRVHAAGFALGAVHTEAFAYGIGWGPHPLSPVPTVSLAHAPCATRLGDPYAPPAAREMLPSHYRRLRTPVLVPLVAGAQTATPERDMPGFGAFVLDLLLEEPVVERGAVDWYDAERVVRERATAVSKRPELAKNFIRSIEDPLGWRRLLALCERLSSGRVSSVSELV